MPTSVLLAVLAAAGLLALAPALVRRYDATERLVAERARSTARVLNRTRRRRTVPLPGRPLHPLPPAEVAPHAGVRPAVGQSVWLHVDRVAVEPDPASGDADPVQADPAPVPMAAPIPVRRVPSAADLRAGTRPNAPRKAQAAQPGRTPSRSGGVSSRAGGVSRAGQTRRSPGARGADSGVRKARPTPRRPRRRTQSPSVYRRRRVLAGLILLNVIELIGVTTVSPGFWTGFAVTLLLLGAYVVHLRNSAIVGARTRRFAARRAAQIAVAQAEIREEHERRLAARREALRRAAVTRAAAQRDAQRLSQRYVDHDPERGGRLRGRPYEAGRNEDDRAAGF